MFDSHSNSTSQQIASLRQYFRTRRQYGGKSGGPTAGIGRTGQRLASLFDVTSRANGAWVDTQWSDTRQDEPVHDD